MKTFIFLICFLFSGMAAAEESLYSAQLFFFKGDVSLSTDGGDFGVVEKGDSIGEGDIIKTGKRSLAIIRFPDKSTMRVDPNSEIKIERVVERVESTSLGSSDIFLKSGRAVIDVINKSKAPVFNVRTAGVAMGVRGTRLMAGIDPESGTTDLAVDRGEVEVSRLGNPSISDAVGAGQAILIEKDREFSQPKKYDWVRKFNFNANDEKVDHAKNNFVHEEKRREFRKKRQAWKRDPAKWKEKKEKWKKLRSQYLSRSENLKEKRKEYRAKKKEFKEKRKAIIKKRNDLIGEAKALKVQKKKLEKERALLAKEVQSLRSGRKDPRAKMKVARKRKAMSQKIAALKEKRSDLLEKRKSLREEKKSLFKEFRNTKKDIKKLQKKRMRDQDKMRRMRKRMRKMKMKKKKFLQNRPSGSDGAGGSTGGGANGG